MRLLKLAIISFVVLFTIVFLFSLMIPSQVRVSRAANLHERDLGAARRLMGDTAWRAGRLPPDLKYEVHLHPGADSATIQWYTDFRSGYLPWNKFRSLFYEDTYGALMERELEAFRLEVQRSR